MEWHQNSCSLCQGFNYFYCDKFFFVLDTNLCFNKKDWKIIQFWQLFWCSPQKNSSRCCQLLILSWSELVCFCPTLYTAYLLQSLASVWETVPFLNHIFNPQLDVVIIFLAFQTPKQALQVLQTPSVQSSSHLPFLHSLAGNKYIVMLGDPLEPLSALKWFVPLRFLILGSIMSV